MDIWIFYYSRWEKGEKATFLMKNMRAPVSLKGVVCLRLARAPLRARASVLRSALLSKYPGVASAAGLEPPGAMATATTGEEEIVSSS